MTQTPGLRDLAKLAAGIARERRLPPFAPFTFKEWFAARPARPSLGRPRVILWPDTFNNHFHPRTAIHAVHVLERAGFEVDVPQPAMCCGRPLYDYGMLDTAKGWLRQIIDRLRTDIEAGVPVVGLEPSCVSVFRDELTELLPGDADARRLAGQTWMLGEFLVQQNVALPKLQRRALVHGHCHHKAVLSLDADEEVLRRIGLQYQLLDSGCCGMAGAFGFERRHFDVSMAIGERVLLPAVRTAARDTLVIADGFSCRTQIADATSRRAMHLADVLEMAAQVGPRGPAGDDPERRYVPEYKVPESQATAVVAGAAVGAGAAAYAMWRARRRRSGA